MPIFADTHIHIYPSFPVNELLDAALSNLNKAITKAGMQTDSCDKVLCLAESYGINVFQNLLQQGQHSTGDWNISPADDPTCLICTHGKTQQNIYLMAGRQLESSERLEVIAMLEPVNITARMLPIHELAASVHEKGGVPVIPWGVGKWTGKRLELLIEFLKSYKNSFFLLGDNGNRPGFWSFPSQCSQLLQDRKTLPGSDPLPLKNHHLRAGSYGCYWPEQQLDPANPAGSMKKVLTNHSHQLITFGKQRSMTGFITDQLTINVRNRLPG